MPEPPTPWTPRLDAAGIGALLATDFPLAARAAGWIEGLGEGWLELRWPLEAAQRRPGDSLSGPTLMRLSDTAMFFLVLSHVGPVPQAVTSSLHIDFLRRPALADLHARANLLRLGRRLAVGTVAVTSAADPRPVAHASVTYALPTRA